MINTAHQRFGGAVQVALSFINECRNFNDNEYIVILGTGLSQLVDVSKFPQNFKFEIYDFGTINFKKVFVINKVLQRVERKYSPDVIISTTGPSYFHSRAPQIMGFNLGLYLYSDSPYVKEITGLKRIKFLLKKRIHYYFFRRDAVAFVTQTNDVNLRVRKELGFEEVFTVTNNASSYYNSPDSFPRKLVRTTKLTYRFLTISAFYPHKNLELIKDVAKILRERGRSEFEFVLTIKTEDFERVFKDQNHIVNIGPIPPVECPSLYRECDAMFLPTLVECFSASYPEAMIMDKPIITSDLGFAHSICGEAALYFRPKDAEAAADQIVRLLDDKQLEKELIKQGHEELKKFDSPQERANKYLKLCSTVAMRRT